MKITIAGIGNAGTTIAADLSHKGHDVTMLKTSKSKIHNEHYCKLLETKQIYVKDFNESYYANIHITDNFEFAIKNAELVIIYIQTNYHKEFIKKIAPYIKDGQTFIIEPGYLSTCYFLSNTQKNITIIEAESSPIDCRIEEPGKVNILFKNAMNPFGVYPKSNQGIAENILKQLEYPYIITKNVIEAALHNPNLIVHTVGAIFSIPRIEYTNGDYYMYKEVFTPHIWNIVEALDNEKMNILEKLGCERISYLEACKFRNSLDTTLDAKQVFFDYANNSSPRGPSIPDSRYITEDVSQGLVMLESLAKFLDIKTPVCTSLINIASASLQIDFRKSGRVIEDLGLEFLESIKNQI